MALGCGAKVLKYCLFAFNLIFFIAGILCLGIGIWLLVGGADAIQKLVDAGEKINIPEDQQSDLDDLRSHPKTIRALGIILIIGGAIVFFIAFLGCCGAVKEWRPLLVLYAIFLMIILAIELAAVIYAGVNHGELEGELQNAMKKPLKFYNYTVAAGSKQDPWTKAWDALMKDQKCCGVLSDKSDFLYSRWWNKTEARKQADFPPGCCPKTENDAYVDVCSSSTDRYEQGCYDAVKELLKGELAIVIGVAAGVAAIQLIGVIFALCLCSSIGKETYA